MTVKVSVVVPVYNTGENLRENVDALLRQSLPSAEFEAIFVDDGSTDDTGALLDGLAARHDHIRVIHQENSGWPGKPRNTGIDAARGEFIMFVDDDDYLGDEALERMYDYGVANGADVVIGKMAGRGRAVPKELFRVNRPKCDVDNAPLMDSLTCHKMVRRSLLVDNGIRFPEGRHRLEDHLFVTEVYLRASSVAVLSDYICYNHVRREGAGNISQQHIDPDDYFGKLAKSLDVVDRYTEPGRLRNKLYRRWLRVEMIEPLRKRRYLNLPDDLRGAYLEAIRRCSARFGPGVAAGLKPIQQVVAGLIRVGDQRDLEALAQWEANMRATATLDALEWTDGRLAVEYSAEFAVKSTPMAFTPGAKGPRPVLPIAPATDEALLANGADLEVRLKDVKADLVLRDPESGADFFQEYEPSPEEIPTGEDRCRIRARGRAVLDPAAAVGGTALAEGRWELIVRLSMGGWTMDARPATDDAEKIATLAGLGVAVQRPKAANRKRPLHRRVLGRAKRTLKRMLDR
ncbi:glycosyltransferase family 2 protein [Glycomyces tritici]|uniref:Glycosyltransferase family 2 protein n=1 Tax=Glycomyces tritici TaxID=2665176 RepID=A0ABT7YP55_9ACTN|nr:glycosyltransferase family 2 protein [Glycomyces tritici]MDN3240430.1 glycosyltransferase family 2 protein [Glycomyces tritici]